MSYFDKNIFSDGAGVRPARLAFKEYSGMDAGALVNGNDFTITNVASTVLSQNNIGGRPVWDFTNAGSGATDGVQLQVPAGCILLQPGKTVRLKGSVRMTTTTQEFFVGLAAIDTSIIASAPTDYIGMRKLTTETLWRAVTRKASGTAETWGIAGAIAADTWYDFEVVIKLDPSIAGRGNLTVYNNSGASAGNPIGNSNGNGGVAAQMPDTVLLSPAIAWRAGSAANVSCYVGQFGWVVEG